MKPISKIQWNRYKLTDGKAAIEQFDQLLNIEVTEEELIAIVKQINPSISQNWTINDREQFLDIVGITINISYDVIKAVANNVDKIFPEFLSQAYQAHEIDSQHNDISSEYFSRILGAIMPISIGLSSINESYFIPYLWTMQFYYLERIAAKYAIALPAIPKKSDYKARCEYYIEYCKIFKSFAEENNLSRAELCAFLYDYELNLLREELAEESHNEELPVALQAWFLVGKRSKGEETMTSGFWQANPETCRGDIFLFYETSPVKSINAIWRAITDGTKDPLFYYYSSANISDKIEIPAITLEELRSDYYFKNHALVRKNFQGGSGWPLTSKDYNNLMRLLSSKGFDVSSLPKLRAHESPDDLQINNEADVHKKLVLPILKDMGWTIEKGDIKEQVTQHLGRGKTQKMGRTDVSLHPISSDFKEARVIIEEKYDMRNEAEIKDAFEQGKSYAKQSTSHVLMTCDKKQIFIYLRNPKESFDYTKSTVFYWDEMGDPDKFNELRKLLK